MISFLQAITDTTDLTTYTFASANLGAEASDRHIIVGITSRKAGATTSISSVTIGGVSANIVVQRTNTVTNTDVSGLAIAEVPTGTTGDIVVTFGAGMVRCAVGVWRATGLSSATAFDSDSSVAADPTVNLDIPDGGLVVGTGLTAAASTAAWTGLTEDYDGTLESFVTYTGAHDNFPTALTGRTITIDFGSSTESTGSFASWESLFPTPSSRTTTSFATSVTSMPVNLPGSIVSGELLLAITEVRTAGTWTLPTDWFELPGQAGGGAVGELTVFYKIADGTEGATATWTASTGTSAIWQTLRVGNWDGTTPPEITSTSGDATAADPPSLSPSWGAGNTLWLGIAGHAAVTTAAWSAGPAGYSDFLNSGASSGGGAVSLASAYKDANASSEDPGAFTVSGSNRFWAAITLAIKAVGAGAVTTTQDNSTKANILVANNVANNSVKADILVGDNTSDNSVKADIQNTYVQNNSVKANILTPYTQDNNAKADVLVSDNTQANSIKANVLHTSEIENSAKANVVAVTEKENSVLSNILAEGQQPNSVKGNILRTNVINSNSTLGNILTTYTSENSVKANIVTAYSQENNSKADILVVDNIAENSTKADILVSDNIESNSSKASIVVTNEYGNDIKANILAEQSKNNSTKANILAEGQTSNSVKANILRIDEVKDNSIKASIVVTNITDNEVKANIVVTETSSNSTKANILTEATHDNNVVGSILNAGQQPSFVKANILRVDEVKNTSSKASIVRTESYSQETKASVVHTNTNDNSTKADVLVIESQDNSIKANILKTLSQDSTVKGNILATSTNDNSVKASLSGSFQSNNSVKANIVTTVEQSNYVKADIYGAITTSYDNSTKASINSQNIEGLDIITPKDLVISSRGDVYSPNSQIFSRKQNILEDSL